MAPCSYLRLVMALGLICSCKSYKMLMVVPFPGVSHGILGEAMVRQLLADGHEITYITAIPLKEPLVNLTHVDVSSLFSLLGNFKLTIANFMDTDIDVHDYNSMLPIMHHIVQKTLMHENVQKLIHDPKANFDLVINEWMYSEMYSGFAAVFDCPYIWFSSMDPHWFVLRLIDETPNPAYVSDNFADAVPPFTFFQRLSGLWTMLKVHYIWMTHLNAEAEEAYTAAFKSAVEKRGRTLSPLNVMKFNASLMLGNSHVSTGMPVSLPQSYKPIGGFHIEEKLQPLTGDLKTLIDGASNGVIYFSMGSVLKGKDMPDRLRDDLIKLFGSLKQTVIWKFEATIENLPKNVHVTKWAPQKSILAHPNTILFITHGGLLSTTEAVCFGVPIIGIPGFADQALNVNRAVAKGFAKRVNLDYNLAENLKNAIQEILKDSNYKERVKYLSKVFHARPASPMKELQHWTRHVVETRGAAHLRSLALPVHWTQKLYLDLAGLLILGIVVLVLLVIKLLSAVRVKDRVKKDKSS